MVRREPFHECLGRPPQVWLGGSVTQRLSPGVASIPSVVQSLQAVSDRLSTCSSVGQPSANWPLLQLPTQLTVNAAPILARRRPPKLPTRLVIQRTNGGVAAGTRPQGKSSGNHPSEDM